MRLIKQTTLYYIDDKSDKVYEVDLCEVGAEQFLVNFRYGRRNSVLKEGTKTDLPVNQAAAEKIFDKLVASKTKKGYQTSLEAASEFSSQPKEVPEKETAEPTNKDDEGITLPPEHLEALLTLLRQYITQPAGSTSPPPTPSQPSQQAPPVRQAPPKSDSLWDLLKKWVGDDSSATGSTDTPSSTRTGSASIKKSKPTDRLSRLIWRCGELRVAESLPLLLQVPIGKNKMTDYCLAWAFGRLGDDQSLEKLAELETSGLTSKNNGLLRMVSEAQMACSSTKDQTAFANKRMSGFSARMSSAIESENEESFREELDKSLKNSDLTNTIADLYLISEKYSFVRKMLIEWSMDVPLEGSGYFRGVRQLFKSAEFREDAEIVGILAYRIQTTASNFHNIKYGWKYINGEYVQASKEIAKPDSRLAYSKVTKEYFTRRCARMLRRKGEIGDPSYVKMAVGLILPFKDEDAGKVYSKTFYKYIRVNGQWTYESRTLRYSAFSKFPVFNEILFKNSPRFTVTGNGKWIYADGQFPDTPHTGNREEAYPELWDKMPTGLLHLLAESQCREVHQFAANAAKANHQQILPFVDNRFIELLFGKPYNETIEYALELAKSKYDPQYPDTDLTGVMLNSNLDAAHQIAISWMDANKKFFLNDTTFVSNLLFIHFEEVVAWVFNNIREVVKNQEKTLAVIGRTIARVMEHDENTSDLERQKLLTAGEHLSRHFSETLSQLNLDLVHDLLSHPLSEAQVLGAKILRNHEVKVKDLPEDLLLGLINGNSPELRAVGVELLGQLPSDELANKQDLLLGLCLSQHPEIRQTVKSVVAKLSETNQAFGAEFVQRLTPWLRRKENHEGRDADLLDLLTIHLKNHLSAIGKDETLNLLFCPRKAAHQLGSHLLHHFIQVDDLTLRQIVKLGDNEMVAVREWVWDFYKSNLSRIKYEAADAVRLLDSKWDDSRDVTLQFFRTNFSENDWTPDILVSLCDSVIPIVQQFGKEMIAKFFKQEDGEQYLLQLSQHPTAELQQFATNYLENFATNKPQNIHELKPYFITILSSINKSRVAKKRIFNFLQEEGQKNKAVAEIVADVLARQSVTMAIGDKAKCIEIMRDLQLLYPDLKLPLKIQDYGIYPVGINE